MQEHRKRIDTIVKEAAAALRQGEPPALGQADEMFIETTPDSVRATLDRLFAELRKKRRNDTVIGALHWLLTHQLTLIRYRIDRNYDWAEALVRDLLDRIEATAKDGGISVPDAVEILGAFRDAGLPVPEEVLQVLGAIGGEDEDLPMSLEAAREGLHAVFEQIATAGFETPYEVVEAFDASIGVMPAEIRAFMVLELTLSPFPLLRDTAALFLLDADPAIRAAAAQGLEQTATRDMLSPDTLRRMIVVRNWLPEDDRQVLDRAVRKARSKGVEPAGWPPARSCQTHASMIDGSGAQTLIVASDKRTAPFIAGMLLKQGRGITEVWAQPETARAEVRTLLDGLQDEVTMLTVPRDYLERRVGHELSAGLAAGAPPPAGLLEIAELIGATDWQPRPIDAAAETARLVADAALTPEAVAEVLDRSADWLEGEDFTESWFEDDAAVRKALAEAAPDAGPDAVTGRALRDVLEPRREKWAERFFWLALWARDGKGEAVPPWRDFLVLAHELYRGRPLAEIPLMVGIADVTVAFALSNEV
jgi:hypothetical protein